MVIVCGPPAKCTCPAVAWWCVCGAWPSGVELAAEIRRRDEEGWNAEEAATVAAPERGREGK